MQIRVNGRIIEVEYAPDEHVKVARQGGQGGGGEGDSSALRRVDLAFWAGAMRELPGLKALAPVTTLRPLRFFAATFSNTLGRLGAGVQIKVFNDAAAAREWLEQVV